MGLKRKPAADAGFFVLRILRECTVQGVQAGCFWVFQYAESEQEILIKIKYFKFRNKKMIG
ncbi:hypothetical protein GCM10010969_39730 [Saccharibacillus kuerlensis]|uniref:Uncharacterized protein n=1 Tax=Saccharibacillus kuerlensis TaxID=459527 RepID=A0ABQ2LBD9_9BACL|nr:hypothetical protein GCM10010969_39730 [Saccharibacillus kuerlensis]